MTKNALTNYIDNANLPDLTDEEMAGAIAEATNDATDGSAGGGQYLTFSGKTGIYALGRNKSPIDPEDLYIVEPQSVIEGWTCWKGSKPVDRVEWSIYRRQTAAVAEHDLPDHAPYKPDEGWNRMLGFGVLDTSPEHTSVKFSTTSISGRNAISDLLEEIRKRASAGEPTMPIISFDSEEFTAQDKTNHKPRFDVDRWCTREAVGAYLSGDMSFGDLQSGKKPKKKPRKRK